MVKMAYITLYKKFSFEQTNIVTKSYIRRCFKMEKNNSIGCTVQQCKHHDKSSDYCTLNQIMVGTHEANPTVPECTDCNSFELEQ